MKGLFSRRGRKRRADPQELLQTIYTFIRARTWDESRRLVEEHPELDILTSQSLSFMGGQAETGRFMAMASGTAPDVILLSTRQLPGYIEQGMLLPLNTFVEDYHPWQEISEDFTNAATPATTGDAMLVPEEDLYASPIAVVYAVPGAAKSTVSPKLV